MKHLKLMENKSTKLAGAVENTHDLCYVISISIPVFIIEAIITLFQFSYRRYHYYQMIVARNTE